MIPGWKDWTKANWLCCRAWPIRGDRKNPSELVPFLMAAASQGRKQGAAFNSAEMELIIEVLKQNQSPQEAAKMDKIISLMKMIR